jgi:hypothetical protein
MTDYEKTHKDMNCPFCGEPLIVSESHNDVACPDNGCTFNFTEYKMIQCSGEIRHFGTGAIRDNNEGKGRCDLLPASSLLRLSRHYEAGGKKYGDNNWQNGMPISVLMDSSVRHLLKYLDGWTDEDHLAAACWNILNAMWMEEKRPDMQDLDTRKKGENNER